MSRYRLKGEKTSHDKKCVSERRCIQNQIFWLTENEASNQNWWSSSSSLRCLNDAALPRRSRSFVMNASSRTVNTRCRWRDGGRGLRDLAVHWARVFVATPGSRLLVELSDHRRTWTSFQMPLEIRELKCALVSLRDGLRFFLLFCEWENRGDVEEDVSCPSRWSLRLKTDEQSFYSPSNDRCCCDDWDWTLLHKHTRWELIVDPTRCRRVCY